MVGPGCAIGRVSSLVEVEPFDWQQPFVLESLSPSEFRCGFGFGEDSGGDAGSPLARLELSGMFIADGDFSEGLPCCDNTDWTTKELAKITPHLVSMLNPGIPPASLTRPDTQT